MRGLFVKIFAILWLAQSLIFVISTTLIVRQRFPSPNILSDALDSNLRHDAEMAVRAYDTGGCSGFMDHSAHHEPAGSVLLDQQGQTICRTPNAQSLEGLRPHFPDRVDGRQLNGHYIWLVPIESANGTKYEFVWFQPPSSSQRAPRHGTLFHFAFPQLPVAIAIGGVATFVLVLLFTRPLVRLRVAARQLAGGNLKARVEEQHSRLFRPQTDEFEGLVRDFNHMAERLESLVDAQKLLLRDVSHELRTPLTRLSVALELAREDASSEINRHLARIEREAEKLNELIGQLLTLSSIEAKEDTSNFKSVSLNQICEELLPDAEYEAHQRPCTVVLHQDAECFIRGNSSLLHHAIENVVRNAIRYTAPTTQVTIRILSENTAGRPQAIVEVTDCGPGIPEAELANIFRPFYRVDQDRNPSTGGFGVGLAIAERAIRLHSGVMSATNVEGGGARVRMELPLSGNEPRNPR